MRKFLTMLAAGFAFALCAAPSFAAELYEDPATGQVFTKPGEGRVPVAIPDEKAGALYEDPESGAVFTKPAPGRVAVIEPAVETTPQATAVQTPPSKDEVLAVLPEWMQKIKLGGDFRLRYQHEERPGETSIPRDRARYRLRVGMDANIIKALNFKLGLASGGQDRRSTNQTFENFFEKNDFWIDYAYVTFKPINEMAILGGRMKNPLYTPTDMLWDTDINPMGGALTVKFETGLPMDIFANGAIFLLDESGGSKEDQYMYVFQPGVKVELGKTATATLAGSYYGFNELKGNTAPGDSANNTLTAGRYEFDYDSIVASGDLTFNNLIPNILPSASIFGEYVNAFRIDENNEGWIGGVKLGSAKIGNFGDWSVRYTYRRLEKDAFVAFLPDSDFFGGNTGVSGHEVLAAVGLLKNTWLELDYYKTRTIATNVDEHLFQADLNFKF